MQKSNDLTLKEAIDQLLQTYKMNDKMVAMRVEQCWPKVMGVTVAKLTRSFFFRKGILTIKVDSAVLRQELSMSKSLVMEHLNTELESNIITDVVIS